MVDDDGGICYEVGGGRGSFFGRYILGVYSINAVGDGVLSSLPDALRNIQKNGGGRRSFF